MAFDQEDLLRAVAGQAETPEAEAPEQKPDPADLERWRADAARLNRLPAAMAGRLQGSTEIEVFADAKKLTEEMGEPERSQSAEQTLLARKAIKSAALANGLLANQPVPKEED